MLAPDARAVSWDGVRGRLGPDVRFVDRALARVFAYRAIAPARIAIAGFSDGASYALTLGLANGDLFGRVLGFAPGFLAAPTRIGWPRVQLWHGVEDRVLPIDACSRSLVPALAGLGYQVELEELAGGHEVPAAVASAAFASLRLR